MVDPALERRLADCQELVDAWRTFLEMYSIAVRNSDAVNPQKEQEFLSAKARVAMLHDSFMDSLQRDRQTGGNMIGLVNRSITLKHLSKMSVADQKKMEIEWNEVFLLLSDTITALEEERAKLADVSETAAKLKRLKEVVAVGASRFFGSIWFKIAVFVFILVGLVGSLFIFETELRQKQWSKKPYEKFLAFQRNVLGMSAPYNTIDEFFEGAFPKADVPRPAGIAEWAQIDGMDQGVIANFLNTFVNSEVSEMARSSQGGKGFAITMSAGNADKVQAAGLIWFSEGDAMNFERKWRDTASGKDDFEIIRKANVVVVLRGPREFRIAVNSGIFSKAPG